MFSPIKTTKVYEQVIEQIQQMIIAGDLKRGQKLPSERDLADQLQVGRASVREALRALQIIGVIEVRQGDGSFIRESFEESLFEPLSLIFILQQSKPREIIELRRVIELETAYLAAQRSTDEETREMRELINELKELKDLNDEQKSVEVDQKLHYLIARGAKNLLLLNVLHVSSVLIDNLIAEARGRIMVREENKDVLIEQHEKVVRAIEERNPELAKLAMKEHIDFISKQYLDTV